VTALGEQRQERGPQAVGIHHPDGRRGQPAQASSGTGTDV
jgi:hypothetical protein